MSFLYSSCPSSSSSSSTSATSRPPPAPERARPHPAHLVVAGEHVTRAVTDERLQRLQLLTHHGIVSRVDDGIVFVIHFFGDNEKDGCTVREDTWETFMAGEASFSVIHYAADADAAPHAERVARAAEWIGRAYPDYNVLTNNCEHFCSRIVYGRPVSYQSNRALAAAAAVLLAALAYAGHADPLKKACEMPLADFLGWQGKRRVVNHPW